MAQPTPYSRQYNFTNFQAVSPSSPLPANYVDLELNSVKATLDATLNNLKIIQRDDTALANATVGYDQLKAELNGFGFNPPSNWATAVQYQVRDTVFENNGFYRCLVSHVSGTFSTDLAAGDWELVADFASIQTAAAASAAAAATSATTATTQASTATTQASTATTKATAAAASATTATNEANAAHTDRLAADADVVSTHADAAQTASDRTASNASATSAANSATAAAASAASTTPVQDQINAAAETALADADELAARQATSGSLIKRTWANLRSQLTSYFLPLTGGTLTGFLQLDSLAAAPAELDLNFTGNPAVAGSKASISARVADVNRWLLELADYGAETGGNTGSDFRLFRADDAGNLTEALVISRATGAAAIDGAVTVTGGFEVDGVATLKGNLSAGTAGVATGGTASLTSDDGVARWGVGLLSVANARNFSIYDSVNAAFRLQIDAVSGAVNAVTGSLLEQGQRVYSPNNPPAFSAITSKPTTLAGYGITDGAPAPTSSTLPVGWSGLMSATSIVNSGATCAGSNLRPDGTAAAPTQSGTWLNISGASVAAGAFGLFVRTA